MHTHKHPQICIYVLKTLLTRSRAVFASSGTRARLLAFHTIPWLELAQRLPTWRGDTVKCAMYPPLFKNNAYSTVSQRSSLNHSQCWPFTIFLFLCLFSLLRFWWHLSQWCQGRWLADGKHLLHSICVAWWCFRLGANKSHFFLPIQCRFRYLNSKY